MIHRNWDDFKRSTISLYNGDIQNNIRRYDMSKISISTTKYSKNKTREVEIDGINFIVRKPGAGEQLDSLENVREMNKLKDRANLAKTEAEQVELADEMSAILAKIEGSYVDLFDDGTKTQKKSKKLIRKIGIENIGELLNDIFREE